MRTLLTLGVLVTSISSLIVPVGAVSGPGGTPLALPPLTPGRIVNVAWVTETTLEFQGHSISIPAGVWASTDGSTYLYATKDQRIPLADGASTLCAATSPPRGGVDMVLIDNDGCFWVAYPGVGCSLYVDPCDGGAHLRPPKVAGDGSLLQQVGLGEAAPNTVTNDQYLQFGLGNYQLPSSQTNEGVNGQIIMSSRNEAFTFTAAQGQECHFRWPGMSWAGTFTHRPFLQIGTYVCNDDTDTSTFGVFCDYFDQNGGEHRSNRPTRIAFSTSWHQYTYTTLDDTSTYNCIVDGTTWMQFNVYTATQTSPYMWSAGEVSYISTGLDTTKETFATNQFNVAVQRVIGTVGVNLDHENWYFSALGGSTGPCSFSIGVSLDATEQITPGTGKACHNNGDSAW